jgi:hypothetical protein
MTNKLNLLLLAMNLLLIIQYAKNQLFLAYILVIMQQEFLILSGLSQWHLLYNICYMLIQILQSKGQLLISVWIIIATYLNSL